MYDQYMSDVFGEAFTTYGGIIAQTQAAERNPDVQRVVYDFDTPGGHVKGVEEAGLVIATCTKPTVAVSGGMVASAGYWLASQAGEIVALDRAASFGSIGTVVDLVDASAAYEKMGVKFYSITSKNAPKKRLEPHSEEFIAEIQERVDALGEMFATTVAEGRSAATGESVSVADVEKNFGRGGLLLADAAKAAGMIDAVEKTAKTSNKEDNMADNKVDQAVHEQAVTAARDEGVSKERARVASLLPWMNTDSERVMQAIESGEEMGPELMTELSKKAAENAKEQAIANAKAEAEAEVEAAAKAREEDDAPEVSGLDAREVDEEKAEEEDLFAAAMGMSKHKGAE
jgi:ClpP class serine protease